MQNAKHSLILCVNWVWTYNYNLINSLNMFSLQLRQLHLLHLLHLQALHAVIPANKTQTLTLRMWQGRYRPPLSTLTYENAEREKASRGTEGGHDGQKPTSSNGSDHQCSRDGWEYFHSKKCMTNERLFHTVESEDWDCLYLSLLRINTFGIAFFLDKLHWKYLNVLFAQMIKPWNSPFMYNYFHNSSVVKRHLCCCPLPVWLWTLYIRVQSIRASCHTDTN